MRVPLRVVIADDHPYYRRGLARSLRASGFEIVAQAPNGAAAVRAAEGTAPDVVIMDLKMPGMSGVEATRLLTERTPAVEVLVLTVSAEESDVIDAMLAGAGGYVLKDRPVDELIAAIQAAASGRPQITAQVALPLLRRIAQRLRDGPHLAGLQLAPQDTELLDLLADDSPDHAIAETLGVSPDELFARASRILSTLQLEDRLRPALRAGRGQQGGN